jgi:hypothetical protein
MERTVTACVWWNTEWTPSFRLSDVFEKPIVFWAIKPNVERACRFLFDLSLEELIPYINEPEPYISLIEWRLKLGK